MDKGLTCVLWSICTSAGRRQLWLSAKIADRMSLTDSQSPLYGNAPDDVETEPEREHRKWRQKQFAKKAVKHIGTQVSDRPN